MWLVLVRDQADPAREWAAYGLLDPREFPVSEEAAAMLMAEWEEAQTAPRDPPAPWALAPDPEPSSPAPPEFTIIQRVEIDTPAPHAPSRCWAFDSPDALAVAVSTLDARGLRPRSVEVS